MRTEARTLFAVQLGRELQTKRQSRGMSRYKLSQLSGISDTQLAAYEQGRQIPGVDILHVILKTLQIKRWHVF